MADNKKEVGCSTSIAVPLTVLFVVLKLTHTVQWSWVWVLSPLWIGAAITAALVLLGAVVAGVVALVVKSRR